MIFDNYQFHYFLSGSKDKPLILFLHGFMGDRHDFDEVISLLSERFCYLTVDLPGHGKTKVVGGDECYTMENTAHALINLLDRLNVEKCFLVGYSMGGRLGLYLTIHFPQRFFKVVLESASPGLRTEEERIERVKRDFQIANKLGRSLERSNFRSFLLNWYSQSVFGMLKHHQKFEMMLESRLQNNPAELAKSLRNLSTGCQPSLWEKLKDNKNALLLLVGEYDDKFIAINTEMAVLSEYARLEVVNNCGHNIHFEKPEVFVKNIRQFLIHTALFG